jgi:hypothetical protein
MLIVAVGLIGGRIQGTMPQITDKLDHIMLYENKNNISSLIVHKSRLKNMSQNIDGNFLFYFWISIVTPFFTNIQ